MSPGWISAVIGVLLLMQEHPAEPPLVELEIFLPRQERVADTSGDVVRIEAEEPVVISVRVSDLHDPQTPVDVEETFSLLEIRDLSGDQPTQWLGYLERVGPGHYRADYEFRIPGRWAIVAQPDVPRSERPPGSTDQITLMVQSAPPSSTGQLETNTVLITLLLIGLVALVMVLTRGRRRRQKEPILHDTWWWPYEDQDAGLGRRLDMLATNRPPRRSGCSCCERSR